MKRILMVTAIAVLFSGPVHPADVGVSISIGQPGFFGQLELGDFPTPQVIYTQPRYIERVYHKRAPIYLRVPPKHMNHWGKYCHRYQACGERVYFVKDDWYDREYVPRYKEKHRVRHEAHSNRGGHGHDDHRRDERRDDRRDNH
jgi:hypothetical protein